MLKWVCMLRIGGLEGLKIVYVRLVFDVIDDVDVFELVWCYDEWVVFFFVVVDYLDGVVR